RQQVGDLYIGRIRRAVVGEGHSEGDRVAHVGVGVADCLGQGQVSLLGIGRGRVAVVGGVRVKLIGVVNRRRVRGRVGVKHLRSNDQGLRRAGIDGADSPDAGVGVVAAFRRRKVDAGNVR